jgi:hypothetical protein
LNYVWASKNPVGASWPKPLTPQARIVDVNSGAVDAGRLTNHRRNVRKDLRAAFGEEFTETHAFAIMTDGDCSGQQARAWYGDITFSKN